MQKSVTVKAPATVANLACGFDVLGLALTTPYDQVTVTLVDQPGVLMNSISPANINLPKDSNLNTASIAVTEFLKKVAYNKGVHIDLIKNLPLGSGLGSSASSAAGAVVAINKLLGEPLTRTELIPFALESERIACGTAHADNAAPAILGGIVLIRSYQPLDIISLPCPSELQCVVVHPHIELKTSDSRKVLQAEVQLKKAIMQSANLAGFIAGLYKNDYELISRSLEDVLVEPTRGLLIPGFSAVKKTALKAGALGASISGSGPSIFALVKSASLANQVGASMQAEFSNMGIKSDLFVSAINTRGVEFV